MAIELGEQPTPEVEPAEPNPGGIDAIDDEDSQTMPVIPELFPADNLTDNLADHLADHPPVGGDAPST